MWKVEAGREIELQIRETPSIYQPPSSVPEGAREIGGVLLACYIIISLMAAGFLGKDSSVFSIY